MSGAPGIETAIGGSPIGFVLARAGTPRHRVRAGLVGGAPDITRLLACVPLLIAGGGVLSITVREDFGMTVMSVARTEAIGAATVAVIAANGATTGVIVATVAKGLTSAMIVVKSLVAKMIAVKITSARNAVIAAMTFAASGGAIVVWIAVGSMGIVPKFPAEILLAGSARAMMPVPDETAAIVHAEKRAAIVNPVRRAAEEGAVAATMTIGNLRLASLDAQLINKKRRGLPT